MSTRASFRNRYQGGGSGLAGKAFEITEAVCLSEYQPQGFNEPVAAMRVTFDIEDRDTPLTWHFTVGNSSSWEADDDGAFFIPKFERKGGGDIGISSNSELGIFVEALEANAPALYERFCEEGAPALVGTQGTLGIVKQTRKNGKERDVYVIEEVSGEESGESGSDSLESKLEAIIGQIIENGPVKVSLLQARIMAVAKADKQVKALMQLSQNRDFLAAEERPWVFNEKKLTVGLS